MISYATTYNSQTPPKLICLKMTLCHWTRQTPRSLVLNFGLSLDDCIMYMYIFQVCYDLCCPHGYHYINNTDFYDENLNVEAPFKCGSGSQADFSMVDIWDNGKK